VSTTRRPRATWLGRFLRGNRPDHNPLRRPVDYAQSAILAVLIAGFCVGVPLLGRAAADSMYSASVREMQSQRVSDYRVRATLLDPSVSAATYPVSTVPEANARWVAPDGRTVTGVVSTPTDAPAGSTVLIWTDRSGQLVSPLQPGAVGAREGIAVLGAVTGLGGIESVAGWLALGALNRRRMAAWDADWITTEPRWTSRC